MESKFIADLREKLTLNLYQNFLLRDPINIFKKNSSEYIRNFNDEVTNVVLFYRSIIQIVLDLIVLIGLLIFLFIYNLKISSLIAIFLFIIGIIYYSVVKNRLVNWAKTAILNRKKEYNLSTKLLLLSKKLRFLPLKNTF